MKIAALLALLSGLAMASPAMAAPITAKDFKVAESKELAARNNPIVLGALTGAGLATVVGGLVGGLIDHRDVDALEGDVHASAATAISHTSSSNDDNRKHAGTHRNHRSIIPRTPQTKTSHCSGSRMPWAAGYTSTGLNQWPAPASKKGGN
nr:hypothetical protein B0A51_00155 [Rachicladosporium sp. CCFEE 5018]